MEKRDYGSNYSIKQFMLEDIMPMYFDKEICKSNIGIFGYLTDIQASTTEDTTNVVSTYVKEIFPNLAQIPESIYTYAGLYHVDDLFATPSKMSMVLFIPETDVINNATKKDDYYEFMLDGDTIVDIEGKQFIFDYDIKVSFSQIRDDYSYTATYVKEYNNSLNDSTHPYIPLRRIQRNNANFIALIVTVRRVVKSSHPEILITNDRINVPKIVIDYEDQLANFEVLYKATDSDEYIQLTKKFYRSPPVKSPFCHFRLLDENRLEISFSSRDTFFKPKFNSEIIVIIYTCNGKEDDFPLYNGDDVLIIPNGTKYRHNTKIMLRGVTTTESNGGRSALSLEEIKELYLEKMITVDSYTTETDLQIYFNSIRTRLKNDILFIKKRDDVFERLFMAFSLLRNKYNEVYHTNTLHLNAMVDELESLTKNSYIIKPGKVFSYEEDKLDTVNIRHDLDITSVPENEDDFLYTNPFLMYVQKNPESVNYYINSINEVIPIDFMYNNPKVSTQFILGNIEVYRNAIIGDDSYTIRFSMNPSDDRYKPIMDDKTKEDMGNVIVKGFFSRNIETDTCMVDFKLVSGDVNKHVYTYEAVITTDDFITLNNQFKATNVKDVVTNQEIMRYVDMGSIFKIALFYNEDIKEDHRYSSNDQLKDFALSNIYICNNEFKINFITPISYIRSKLTYTQFDDSYRIGLSFLPLISTDVTYNKENLEYFLANIKSQYIEVSQLIGKVTSNYSVDIKLYNTYGRSKNFTVDETQEMLDRVNCGITLMISPELGVDTVKLVDKLKIFIKKFIEEINDGGFNGIYWSNLSQAIENEFPEVIYLKFIKINDYNSLIQVIETRYESIEELTKEDLRNYVPEFLTMEVSDINIQIIESKQKQNTKIRY